MSSIKREFYTCYHCDSESLKLIVYSYSTVEPLIFRTDGSCSNHPVHNDSDFVMWCPHCENFVLTSKLKRGQNEISEEYENDSKSVSDNYREMKRIDKMYFYGSEKYVQEKKKIDAFVKRDLSEKQPKERWFRSLSSCKAIIFALNSEEFINDEVVRYQLRLNYWRKYNRDENFFDDDYQDATSQIFEKLMKTWENKTDERYLFRAEMLRNIGKFKESNKLLKNPLLENIPILEKHKKWARVIKTMNGLKYKKAIEINI